ncbi:hypothetical protein HNP38_001609 [Chryseobacterium defluvii]|uniref:Uncharacterized protein n=1 Tax=Chryseobacterium defluvii TaxID=160396 RepID=A0A840KED9_9FLAO|nr:hypothetical protein [Chryseobacterium defluvii]MBB4806337.1 hypothetical protein [Chryseobacterium defluvii]
MKRIFLHAPVLVLIFITSLLSCKTAINMDANLPKDISEKPVDESSQRYDNAQLDKLKAAIESEIAREKCIDPAEWTFSPVGSKACGGPVSYIAYPKKLESGILPKIQDYTNKMAEYNKKYNITSDCMMATPPSSVKCENEKAVLIY